MKYEIRFTELATQGLARLAKSEPKAFQKALRFIEELKVHPLMGTGHPEPLKGKPRGKVEPRDYQEASYGISCF